MVTLTKVVLAGVDTLILNACYPGEECLDEKQKQAKKRLQDVHLGRLIEQVSQWTEIAKVSETPCVTSWEHEGIKFTAHPKGTTTHHYLLKNGLIDLMMGPHLPNGIMVRVRFSSEYLWRRGVDYALMSTHMFLSKLFCGVLELQPAEIHLCVDVVGLPIPHNYERVFVSHAAKWQPIKESHLDKPIYRHHRLQTLQFSGHGNPVSVTIYNKPAEIEQKSKTKRWFYQLWHSHGWDGKLPTKSKKKDRYGLPVYDTSLVVWRVECRIKREALHEMEIEEACQAIDKVPSLWAYCVGRAGSKEGWVRMVMPNMRDTNRGRWNTAEAWESVQNAFQTHWREGSDIEELQREWKGRINLDQAEKAIAGYTTTYAAWLRDELEQNDDVSVVLQRLYDKMLEIWEKKGTDFQTQRLKKQDEYHIPQKP